MRRLQGKKVLVTGAAQGLGAALLERFAREGASIAGWDLNLAKMEETAAQIGRAHSVTAVGMGVDVCDEAAVARAMTETAAALGGLDCVVSNAGILISGNSLEFEAAKWRKVIEVNLVAYFMVAREAARVMLQAGTQGTIIQINSKSGKKGSFRNTAYAASKFGGIGVTQSLALEFADQGIRVNAICPGNLLEGTLWKDSLFKQYAQNQGISEEEVKKKYVDQVPMKRPCTYEDVANVAVFLASEESGYMTGQAINVTGGQEMR